MGGAARRSRTPPPPRRAEGSCAAGQPSRTGPAPEPRRAPPRPARACERAGRRHRALSATRPRRELRSGGQGHGGASGPDHVAEAPPEHPRSPGAPAWPFLRPGHGRPRRPTVRRTTRGTRGRAARGRRPRGAYGRPGTELGTPRMLSGSVAPPEDWAWKGCGGRRASCWGGPSRGPPGMEGECRRQVRVRAPNFVESASLWGRDAPRSGVVGAGSRAGAAQRPGLTLPFRPRPRRWRRAARLRSRRSCWRCPPARGCLPGPSRTHSAAAPRPRAPGRAQSRAARREEAAGAATATQSSLSLSNRRGSWSAGPEHPSG